MNGITDLYRRLFGRPGTQRGTDIDMSEHGRAGGISTGQPFKFVDNPNYQVKLTESGNYTYIAFSNPGTAQSSASWQCFRLDDSTGLVILYADGDPNFDNVATDLTALSYL